MQKMFPITLQGGLPVWPNLHSIQITVQTRSVDTAAVPTSGFPTSFSNVYIEWLKWHIYSQLQQAISSNY